MSAGKVILGTMAGIAIGAIAGILFAPEKGSKMRRNIMNRGDDYLDDLKLKFDDFLESLEDKFDNAKMKADETVSRGKDKFDEVKKELKNTNNEVKQVVS